MKTFYKQTQKDYKLKGEYNWDCNSGDFLERLVSEETGREIARIIDEDESDDPGDGCWVCSIMGKEMEETYADNADAAGAVVTELDLFVDSKNGRGWYPYDELPEEVKVEWEGAFPEWF